MNNVGSKIFVFFLAFLLWLFIVTGRNYVIETDIPLRIYEPRTDHMLAEKVPDKISVRVGGSGRGVLLMNLFNKGSLILDIGNITKDQRISLKNYFEQRPNQVVLADNITFHEIIFPDSIDIIVDRKIEREVPIRSFGQQ